MCGITSPAGDSVACSSQGILLRHFSLFPSHPDAPGDWNSSLNNLSAISVALLQSICHDANMHLMQKWILRWTGVQLWAFPLDGFLQDTDFAISGLIHTVHCAQLQGTLFTQNIVQMVANRLPSFVRSVQEAAQLLTKTSKSECMWWGAGRQENSGKGCWGM